MTPEEPGANAACSIAILWGDQSVETLAHPRQCQRGGGGLIPQDFISEWKQHAPWPQSYQVEQDLIISRASYARHHKRQPTPRQIFR
jgi:hypothetical protein